MRRNSLLWLLMVPVVCTCLLVDVGNSQEPKSGEKAAAVAPLRGRLPAYFAAVVSKDQRQQIYRIQARVQSEIDKLRSRIAELEASRDKEVDAVLTSEQLTKVKEKRTAAAKRRSQRRSPAAANSSDAATE